MSVQWPFMLTQIFLLSPCLFYYLNGITHVNGGMDDVITQMKGGGGGRAGLRKVSPDKLPARFLADMGIKPNATPAARAPTAAAPVQKSALRVTPAAVARQPTPTPRRTTTRTETTTETETMWTNKRPTERETTYKRQVTFYEEEVEDLFEFTGIIWPKGKYGVYADIKDFEMSDEEKVTTRRARPKVVDTREDGKFVAKFSVSAKDREPTSVYLHIFGSKKDGHVYLDVSDVQWNDVYIFDLNKTEVLAVRPRKVEDELKKLEARDRPPAAAATPVKKEKPKPVQTIQKMFAGLVWPPISDKYTLQVSPQDFDLDARGGAQKKSSFHPDPIKGETNSKGMFDVKLVLTERPNSLYVWVTNAKGARNLFVVPASDIDTSKYALDMRTSKVQPFQRLENVLRKLKADGMVNTEQIPRGPPPKKAAEPAKPAPTPAGSDMLKAIKAMVDDLGKALEKKIEQQHAKLKADIEDELEERVGKKLANVGKRLGDVDDTLKVIYKKLPREIEDVIIAEFDLLYKKKLIGKLDGKA